jgi:hypothetical protein
MEVEKMKGIPFLTARWLLIFCLVLSGVFAAAWAVSAGTPGNEPVFSIFGLVISPTEASTGQTITISATVTESANISGIYEGTLKINDVVEETKRLSVGASGSVQLSFTLSRNEAGTYSVDLDGLKGSFTVTGEPISDSSGSSFPTVPVVIGVVAALVIVGLPIIYWNRKRRTSS